jgi:hypothetical protein
MFLVLYTGNLFLSLSLIGVLAKSASGMTQKLYPHERQRSFFSASIEA